MRQDLLRSISEEKDVTNAVVLTHNIHFVFVQMVVLSVLRRCGQPSLTIFADASCAAASFAHQAPVLHGLGVRYRVVPVEMEPGFRFHPKAVLLSGPDSATLYVGSGNLTFGGWRENAEIWMRFDTRADGMAPFAAFLRYLLALVERIALPEVIRAEIEEAFDAKNHAWAAHLDEPGGLLAKVGDGLSLLDAMFAHLGGDTPEKVTLCAPYFDEDAEALSTIASRSGADSVVVLVQPGRTGLTEAAWSRVSGRVRLLPTTFQRADEQGKPREAFLHAKFYAFERAGRVTVFAGSANCSRAALTIPGRAGNAELMAVRDMTADEFRASFMDELAPKEGSPGLAMQPPDSTPASPAGLRILAASYEGGYMRVGYAPARWRITACFADDGPTRFEQIADGLIGVSIERAPRRVVLEGTDGATTTRSAAGWVDHEWELRSTARGRRVVDEIRRRVRAGEWGVGAWAEVLEVFCAHLRYLPPRLAMARSGLAKTKDADRGPIEYSAKDVFTSGYGLPSLSSYLRPLASGVEGRVHSLQQLLLRWFGLPVAQDDTESDSAQPVEPADGADDVVDAPEALPTGAEEDTAKADERKLRRAARLVGQMTDAMTSAEFLRERPPELLGADLKVASALLRVALREGWLDSDSFFQITHQIWMPLFFDAEGTGYGWLQQRYEAAPSPEEFATTLRAPDLLAALVVWAAVVPRGAHTPTHARLGLAAALAVARLPWLWDGVDDELVCRELAELLTSTTPSDANFDHDEVGESWLRLLKRGHALRRLEHALAGLTPAQLAPRIRQERVAKGELLWQGDSGFGVVAEPAQRAPSARVAVLPLRGNRQATPQESGKKEKSRRGQRKREPREQIRDTTRPKLFEARLTVPLTALLDDAVIPITKEFGQRPREVLQTFLAELAGGFSSTGVRDVQ